MHILPDEELQHKLDRLMEKNDRPDLQSFMGTSHCNDMIQSMTKQMTFSVTWLGSKYTKKKKGKIQYIVVHSPFNDEGEVEAQ